MFYFYFKHKNHILHKQVIKKTRNERMIFKPLDKFLTKLVHSLRIRTMMTQTDTQTTIRRQTYNTPRYVSEFEKLLAQRDGSYR